MKDAYIFARTHVGNPSVPHFIQELTFHKTLQDNAVHGNC